MTEISEGAERPGQHVLSENDEPSRRGLNTNDFLLEVNNQKHMSQTRRLLAVGLLWIMGLLAVIPTIALVLGRWTHFGGEQLQAFAVLFTPVMALASAAFGFFFASEGSNRRR
ncbi:hypothetical protein [Kitasatospora sp. NPDC088351]|uniref:hypothetical protein n=1 Tax=unclassified Kitasatospora TaxID=2633591 RepID=UPI00341DC2FA